MLREDPILLLLIVMPMAMAIGITLLARSWFQ